MTTAAGKPMANSTDMNHNLQQTEWDFCVIGNGISSLWMSHWLWSSKHSVLWITSDDPYTSERAMMQHGWLWGMYRNHAQFAQNLIQGFGTQAWDTNSQLTEFETIYFDAKSTKRFRRMNEMSSVVWGEQEKEFFESLPTHDAFDLWAWNMRVHRFHEFGQSASGPTQIELFSEPRFVRLQGWPIIELKTENKKITSAVLAKNTTIQAKKFILGDYSEFFPKLIQDEASAEILSSALKGRSYHAGFGLHFWHKELGSFPRQTAVIPLVVNPSDKSAILHVCGRFIESDHGLESYWVGFLNDEIVEDNNEILGKIKLTKRALDRAIPGFCESILREAFSFEPRMWAQLHQKKQSTSKSASTINLKKHQSLGAWLITDHLGPDTAVEWIEAAVNGIGVSSPVGNLVEDALRTNS